MRKNKSGFTVAELMVVVVVLAILATIILASYANIQERAKNSQTISAANQWAKSLMIYKVRNGGLPTVSSCLGSNYGYNADGNGTSGVGQCRQDNSTVGVTTQSAFTTALEPYISNAPSPAMITAQNSTTSWYRGLYYYVGAGNIGRLDMVLSKGSGDCPDRVGDISLSSSTTATNGNLLCGYNLGSITSF